MRCHIFSGAPRTRGADDEKLVMSPVMPSIGTRLGPGWGSYLKQAPAPNGTYGDLLADQVRFRIVRSGATTIDDVRPDSRAAEELWKQPNVRTLVQGVLDVANSVSGSSGTPLRGFTLSTSEDGYVANRAVHHFRTDSPTEHAFHAGVAAATRHTAETAAVRKGAWLHLDPERSAGLLHMMRNPDANLASMPAELTTSLGWGVKTILHELNHVGSPRPKQARNMDWLSEGTAETLARWPGRVEQAGKQLGIAVPTRVGEWFDARQHPYQEEVDGVRALLQLAGINSRDPDHFTAAEQLLNGTPEDQLPREFARRIALRQATNPEQRSNLRRRIEQSILCDLAPDGSHVNPARVRQLVASMPMSGR